jgi:hypothetical protein
MALAQRSIRSARSGVSRSDFTLCWAAVGRFVFLRAGDFDFATLAPVRIFACANFSQDHIEDKPPRSATPIGRRWFMSALAITATRRVGIELALIARSSAFRALLQSPPASCCGPSLSRARTSASGSRSTSLTLPARYSSLSSSSRCVLKSASSLIARGGGPSFGARRARRPVVVWPPAHRRDLQRVSLPRIDPASRREPTRPAKRIRPAATVCYPQRDVFIEWRALDWIPAIVHLRRPHFPEP